ncbi:MAG: small-conductance mechanosensitive channel [Myxococcaceae bacterium]|nr:small-conductance mechanosensitive channel [Myxococcaceae bacterium]
MSVVLRRAFLILTVFLSLAPPAFGALLRWGGPPPGFGVFPPQVPRDAHGVQIPTPGFSLPYFALGCLVAGLIVLFLLFPSWFGFTRSSTVPRLTARVPPPWWFWLGLASTVVCWGMMWFSTSSYVKYLFTPLWWGFISVIDGVVYARTGGASIFSRLPRQLLGLVLMSIVGWYFFEWLNWFVLEDWIYPLSPGIFTERQAYFWFTLTYTCVWPAIFEWYTLLRTFPALEARWSRGPKISFGKGPLVLALVLGTTLGVLVGVFPFPLFLVVWLGSLLMLPAAMGLLGFWTPLTPLARGNWSPLVLIGLAGLGNGLFWEFWNHGSNAFVPGRNPNFWVYKIPYVNVIHIFSEMPLLGYFGYLPFGVQCWVWWLVAAHVLNMNPDFDPEYVGLPGAAHKLPSVPPPSSPAAKLPSGLLTTRS